MKILGIDPGTKNCGYAVIEKIGQPVAFLLAHDEVETKIIHAEINAIVDFL